MSDTPEPINLLEMPQWSEEIFTNLSKYRYVAIHGGRGCVHPDTLLDTPDGPVKIRDWRGGYIYSYKDGKVISTYATPAMEFTEEDLYEVTLASGKKVICTDEHKFFSSNRWCALADLAVGAPVLSFSFLPLHEVSCDRLQSNSAFALSVSHEDAQHCSQKHEDYRGDCSFYHHQYGPRPLFESENDPISAPSQVGVVAHNRHVSRLEGDLSPSHEGSHLPICGHASSQDAPPTEVGRNCEDLGNYTYEKSSELPLVSFQPSQQSLLCTDHSLQTQRLSLRDQVLCFLKHQPQNLQKVLDRLFHVSVGIQSYDPRKSSVSVVDADDYILSICKVNRLKYWDLHVPETECYFANGILHHNSSKSWTIAYLIVVQMASKPTRVMCGREVQKSIKESVKKLLDDVIDRCGFRPLFTSIENEIRCQNGSTCTFVGVRHDVNSVKSAEGVQIFWGEEAQTFSEESLKILRPTFRSEGSVLIFTWNPDSPKDPVDAMFRGPEGAPPRSFVREVNWRDNPWFPKELAEEMEHDKKRDYGYYLHVWEGGYASKSNACVFKNWRVEEFEAPKDAFFRFGCDWGFSVDPTCLIRCYLIGRELYFDYEAYQVGCEIDDMPALFATVPDSHKWPIIADSASPERISYMRKHGYPKMMKAIKGRRSIEEGIAFMQSVSMIVHPRCEHLIEEFKNYKYRVDPHTGEISNVLEDTNNHLCVAEGELIHTPNGTVPIQDITTKHLVMTRAGWKPVLKSWKTGRDRNTVIIRTREGKRLRLTDCHKILTRRGWLTASDIVYNDVLLCQDSSWRLPYHKNFKEWFITGILSQPTRLPVIITGHQGRIKGFRYFIGSCGSITMAQFLRGCTYITLTAMLTTTTFQTWSALMSARMLRGIGTMLDRLNRSSILRKFGLSQRLGTLHQKVLSFTKKSDLWLGKALSQKRRIASLVEANFSLKKYATATDSVQTSASHNGAEIKDWMTLPSYAHVAKENLSQTNITRLRLAEDRVLTITDGSKSKAVYDLMVADVHEFFAQGILIMNCDASRYALEAVRRTVRANQRPSANPLPSQHFWS